ncbi:SH3 domain-binding glutamic acid-rich-like protein 3 [Actinia tenebrosa]|uniref:SH3 domain-binding glutamic acid-rich-like protein n=1 Tax=Actinia tenebrosa TaxID=6105 RepID=A0A6P8INB4_ACTTE|nr:SH3 domain-binding glutamic acid-rich-like protein 3 [Actinia tenebrosa]
MSGKIVLYFSSASGNQEIKKQQIKIQQVLDGKKIPYTILDISSDADLRTKMRELMDDEKALPPQIFNGDQYCGNFQRFEEAIEEETLEQFLKLE